MKTPDTLFVLCWLGAMTNLCYGQSAAETHALTLSGTVLSVTYCQQPKSDQLELTISVELAFHNAGLIPIILYRKPDRPVALFRSRDPVALADKHYDEVVHFSGPFNAPRILFSGTEAFPPQTYVVLIGPGESYYLGSLLGFSYCRTANKGCGLLEDGRNYVTARYATWIESMVIAEHLRGLWEPFGYLWLDFISVEPLKIDVATPDVVPVCKFTLGTPYR